METGWSEWCNIHTLSWQHWRTLMWVLDVSDQTWVREQEEHRTDEESQYLHRTSTVSTTSTTITTGTVSTTSAVSTTSSRDESFPDCLTWPMWIMAILQRAPPLVWRSAPNCCAQSSNYFSFDLCYCRPFKAQNKTQQAQLPIRPKVWVLHPKCSESPSRQTVYIATQTSVSEVKSPDEQVRIG